MACTPFITGRVRTREGVETDKGKQSLQGALWGKSKESSGSICRSEHPWVGALLRPQGSCRQRACERSRQSLGEYGTLPGLGGLKVPLSHSPPPQGISSTELLQGPAWDCPRNNYFRGFPTQTGSGFWETLSFQGIQITNLHIDLSLFPPPFLCAVPFHAKGGARAVPCAPLQSHS